MDWDALGDYDDDEDRFFETCDRLSSAVPLDLASSGSDDENEFEDTRLSFASAISSVSTTEFRNYAVAAAAIVNGHAPPDINSDPGGDTKQEPSPSPLPVVLVRSRSGSDIASFSVDKTRKEELVGNIPKQNLTRTSSMIIVSQARIYPCQDSVKVSPKDAGKVRSPGQNGGLTPILSDNRFGAFFLIKNLDTGKEFIVNEYDQDGMWNRVSDLQTGKQLTMEEFEKSVGHSPVVKELMKRENVSRMNGDDRKITANFIYPRV
ncbi:hypothetical protein GH714_010501 [Hevea brasiliensis]|uniref:Uncharacterized protein n=1 Tax=Hevea brasiliensis TaxID=3981 RepID=A0A6A6KIU0_HEVBR|nr:hypothetical protein GH714_010501 [Hevea brasiliensis]